MAPFRINADPSRAMDYPRSTRQCWAMGFPARALAAVASGEMEPLAEWGQISEAVAGGGVVVLSGKRGTGKTVAACKLGIGWYASGRIVAGSARYWRLGDLMSQQKSTFKRGDSPPMFTKSDPFTLAREARLLVLDEADEFTETDFERTELARLVDARYAEVSPTVLITNRPPSELAKRIGISILDRAREGGAFVTFTGESKRGGQ